MVKEIKTSIVSRKVPNSIPGGRDVVCSRRNTATIELLKAIASSLLEKLRPCIVLLESLH